MNKDITYLYISFFYVKYRAILQGDPHDLPDIYYESGQVESQQTLFFYTIIIYIAVGQSAGAAFLCYSTLVLLSRMSSMNKNFLVLPREC